jgi:diguanylate cyclase (GGDEF)-like protein
VLTQGASTPLRLVDDAPQIAEPDVLVDSYRRLADVFHDILGEQRLDTLLERIADTLAELVPHDTLTIYEADEAQRLLVPVLARDRWADQIMKAKVPFERGITGWAAAHREPVLANQAHLDPRVQTVPGTPEDEPESLISVPLVARDSVKGVLNIYRLGERAAFAEREFELAKRFGDAAALALDNAQIRARLVREELTDALTGLHNHRVFHERLRAALRTSSRRHAPVAVLMFDIDDFKRVNDVHGHAVGDELLRVIAGALRSGVRANDIVCRIGGEEFAVIMESSSHEIAERLAGRLIERVASIDLPPLGAVTMSVGIALGPEHAMNPRQLTACAETAMLTAKARGKNVVVTYRQDPGAAGVADGAAPVRDARSVAHLKLLQSLGNKLNRLVDVRELAETIADELRSLIDYHNCRVSFIDGDDVIPVAFRGDFTTDNVALPLDLLRCKVGEGITGRAAATGESLLVGDAAKCPYGSPIPGTPSSIEESLLAVPLRFGSRVNGVIVVSKLGLDQFDEADVRLLEVLAGNASVALENARLFEQARREAESATTLLGFSRELASGQNLQDIFARVVELTANLVSSPRTSIWLQQSADGPLELRGAWGYTREERELVAGQRFTREHLELLDTREPFVADPREHGLDGTEILHPDAQFAIAPLALDGGRRGCIVAAVPRTGSGFGERELRLLGGLAHQAKLALANAGNFETLEQTFISTVEALANALEANDEYTSSHARWISDLSIKVGRELGLDARALKRLELGALFHDIGKIGIPAAILEKPGRLTAEERAIVETHPELGERIIAPIVQLQEVRPIVRHCHERWDGQGYPDRKAGEEIPLESRIIFVCDAFHAMTTDRPYRKRLSAAEARRRLEQAAGTQFDSRVVDACLHVLGSPPRN